MQVCRDRVSVTAISGLKQCDLFKAMRKFANPDISLIAGVLCEGAVPLAELREKTGLTTNILNHDLLEMRSAELVAKTGKVYCITNYGALLVNAIEQIKKDVFETSANELFQPTVTQEAAEESA